MEPIVTGNKWIDSTSDLVVAIYLALTALGGLLSISAKSREWRITRVIVTFAANLAAILGWVRRVLGKPSAEQVAKSLAVVFTLACFIAACSFSLERAKKQSAAGGVNAPTPMCLSLDNSRGTWSAVEQGAIVCAGASGISALPLEGNYQLTAGGAIIGCAVLAGVSHIMAQSKSEQWARYCANEPPASGTSLVPTK